jgi:hypothetical protein
MLFDPDPALYDQNGNPLTIANRNFWDDQKKPFLSLKKGRTSCSLRTAFAEIRFLGVIWLISMPGPDLPGP